MPEQRTKYIVNFDLVSELVILGWEAFAIIDDAIWTGARKAGFLWPFEWELVMADYRSYTDSWILRFHIRPREQRRVTREATHNC